MVSIQFKENTPAKIGVLMAKMGRVNKTALQYLIVHLNTIQTSFEFEILPVEDYNGKLLDPLLDLLDGKEVLNRDVVRKKLSNFKSKVQQSLYSYVDEYNLQHDTFPNKFILLTMARFDDEFYSMRSSGVAVLALGNWRRHMAPPSLLEFFVTLVLRQAVALVSPSLSGSVHLGSKGCLFDFNYSLEDTRLKVLQGFVCKDCQLSLISDGHEELAARLSSIADISHWLGKIEDPTSPSGIVANLGYDLFRTKGVEPSVWERVLSKLEEEGVAQLISIIGQIILVILLIRLGLKQD